MVDEPSPPPWAPEVVVDAKLARDLVRGACPDLAPFWVEPFGQGWDNTAYLVNGTHVFRFPRRKIAVDLLETEARLLPAVAQSLPLAISAPTHLGAPSAAYKWPFAGYPIVPGKTACGVRATRAQRVALAPALGEFLAALHNFDPDQARALGAPPDTIRRADLSYRKAQTAERIESAAAAGLLDDPQACRVLLAGLPEDLEPRDDVLVHGDLYARHFVLDGMSLAGVIDWGDVHLGEPGLDLSVAAGFLPPEARGPFEAAYGSIGADRWVFAKMRALVSALALIVYAADVADDDLAFEGQVALGHLLETTS